MNEKKTRLVFFIIAALLHILVIFFFVFDIDKIIQEESENARIMKLIDLEELPPLDPEIPQVEEIAETMIETDIPPVQNVVAAGSLLNQDNYLPRHSVSKEAQFDYEKIRSEIVYPRIALSSGITGTAILDLYIDKNGLITKVIIMKETPEGRGFGDAAAKAFLGRKVIPATLENGEPVASHFRWDVNFVLK